jgi:hypothetical protein
VQDAATDSPFPGGPSPAELHTRLGTEKRDSAWAPQAEAALRARYEAVPGIAKGLKIRCGATLCEVIADIAVAPGGDENAVMQRLQTPPVTADLGAPGLRHAMAGFSGSALPFYAFWTRATAPR